MVDFAAAKVQLFPFPQQKKQKSSSLFPIFAPTNPIILKIMQLLYIGTTEIIIIVALVLLLFGGRKIPELMKGLGKGVKSFKDGVNGVDEIDELNEKRKSEKANQG